MQALPDISARALKATSYDIIEHNKAFVSNKLDASELDSIFTNVVIANPENPLKTTFWQRFFRKKIIDLFNQLEHGFITINDPIKTMTFGNKISDLSCTINITDINTYAKLALAGSNGSAEAYIDGYWSCDNPTNLVRILLRNRQQLDSIETGLAKVAQFSYKVWHSFNRNSKAGSKKNIASHYDLGNEFFRLLLDDNMMYSSALYVADETLQSASDRKLQRICDELQLNPNDNVIEIGSGWGGFACYAASKIGCKITTITISEEQFVEAKSRVKREGLGHLVSVELIDYRDVKGQYDKLVSIEMIEAVGHQYLDGYFNKINQLLKPKGLAILQAIVIDDDRYQQALKEVDYIKRFIFPGSFIPCYSIIQQTADSNSLELLDQFDMGSSYAMTLRDWRKRFYANIESIDELGYNDKFKRMWEFYMCYCEGGFTEKAISVGQILFRKK